MEKTLLLVATDFAYSQIFRKLCQAFAQRHTVHFIDILGNGKTVSVPDIESAFNTHAIHGVLAGMSNKPETAEAEMRACMKARERGIPYGFFAELPDVAVGRSWLNELKKDASFLFVIDEETAQAAAPQYPKAHTEGNIIVSLDVRRDDWFFPEVTRNEVRRKMGIALNEMTILCPGTKDLVPNILLFGAVVEAASLCQGRSILLSIHPGDKKEHLSAYESLVNLASATVQTKIITKEMMPTSELLVGCDIVVQSMSTVGHHAACLRIPVIDFLTKIDIERYKRENSDSAGWWLSEVNASIRIWGDTMQLSATIEQLTNHGLQNIKLRQAQEKAFPKPKQKGEAIDRVCKAIHTILA